MRLLGTPMGDRTRPPGNGGLWPSRSCRIGREAEIQLIVTRRIGKGAIHFKCFREVQFTLHDLPACSHPYGPVLV